MQPTINDHPMKVVVVDETGQTINDHPLMVTPVGGEGGTPITVEKDGASVVTNLATLNFTGAGVSVADGGSGEATITITAGGGGDGYTQKSQAVTDTTPIEQDSTFVYLGSPATTIETSLVDGHVIVVMNASGASSTVTGHINGADANPYEIPSTQVMTLFCALDMSDFGSPGVITWIALAGGGGGSAVTSVNGQTGDVNLTAANVGAVDNVTAGTGITVNDLGSGVLQVVNNGVTSVNGGTGAVVIDETRTYDRILDSGEEISTSSSDNESVFLRTSGSPYTFNAPLTGRTFEVLQGESQTVQLVLNEASNPSVLRIAAGGMLKNLDITLTGRYDIITIGSGVVIENCIFRMTRDNQSYPVPPISLQSNATDITIKNCVFIDDTVAPTIHPIILDFYSTGRTTPLYGKFINNTVKFGDGNTGATIQAKDGDWLFSGNTFIYTGTGAFAKSDVVLANSLEGLRFESNNATSGDTINRFLSVNSDNVIISGNTISGFTDAINLGTTTGAIVQNNRLRGDIEITASSTDAFVTGNLLTAGAINDAGTATTSTNNVV